MSLLSTEIWMYTVGELALFAGIFVFLGFVYLVTMTSKGNKALSRFFSTLGIAYEEGELSEDEMRDRIEKTFDESSSYTVEQLWNDVERLCEEYKHAGKLEERKKGEGSEQVYNMLLIDMFATLLILGVTVYVNFM